MLSVPGQLAILFNCLFLAFSSLSAFSGPLNAVDATLLGEEKKLASSPPEEGFPPPRIFATMPALYSLAIA